MLSRSFPAVLPLCCLLTALPASIHAQSTGAAPGQQPGYTFHTTTRIVLTDVTVTDRNGNPIHGLRASDFQIFDNSKPQVLSSFEEHITTPVASVPQASTAPGVYSNNFLLHLPPVLNVIVIDITNLGIVDQMYLNYELTQFLNHLPPGEPLAIYWRTGPSSILLQSFTTDRALLLAAVHKAIPHFPPTGRGYYSDFGTLHQIAVDLGQFPGRKNILWFSGGSTLFLTPDPLSTANLYFDPRQIYDELESSRIAICPVDARGLQVAGWFQALAIARQQAVMRDVADATGGTAYYNSNGLDKISSRWLDNSGSYYTLTYSPANFQFDNKWHKVQIKLNADESTYTLSYRRGYFGDGGSDSENQTGALRTRLLAGGKTVTEPDLRSLPIVFQARVLPASESPSSPIPPGAQAPIKKGTIPYSIHYTVPGDALTIKYSDNQKPQVFVGIAAFAFDSDGNPVTHLANKVTANVNNLQGYPVHPSSQTSVAFDQQIDLRKGANYLYLAVWDMTSGRIGTLQIPLQVAAPPKARTP